MEPITPLFPPCPCNIEPSKKNPSSISLLAFNTKIHAIALITHIIAKDVLSFYVTGSTLGCTIGLLVKKSVGQYTYVDKLFQKLYDLEEYSPIIRISCLIVALFSSIWSATPALLLSLSVGFWTGCSCEAIQKEKLLTVF